jgi:hypothetical protein
MADPGGHESGERGGTRILAGKFGDGAIAATLNRLRLRTEAGQQLECATGYGLARRYELPGAGSNTENRTVTLRQAADRLVRRRRIEHPASDGDLAASGRSIRRQRIEHPAHDPAKMFPAKQAVPCAPWEISLDSLNLPAVQQAIENARRRKRPPTAFGRESDPLFLQRVDEVTHNVTGSCEGCASGTSCCEPYSLRLEYPVPIPRNALAFSTR